MSSGTEDVPNEGNTGSHSPTTEVPSPQPYSSSSSSSPPSVPSGATGGLKKCRKRTTTTTTTTAAASPSPPQLPRSKGTGARSSTTSTHTAGGNTHPRPPSYPSRLHTCEHHGDVREDGFYWLKNRSDPAVKRLLREENEYTECFFRLQQQQHTTAAASAAASSSTASSSQLSGALRRSLYREMRSRWKEDDASLPTLDRGFWYYSRNVTNAEYPLYCRRPYSAQDDVNVHFLEEVVQLWRDDPKAPLPPYPDEVIFLDLNLLAQELGLDYIELGDLDVSPDESQVAVAVDCSQGKEIFTLFVLPIDNVNYAQWLRTSSMPMQRAWAQQLLETGQSPYTSPTPSAMQSTPVFPRSPSGYTSRSTTHARWPRSTAGTSKSSSLQSSPSSAGPVAPAGSSDPSASTCGGGGAVSSPFSSSASLQRSHSTAVPPPRHRVLHRISMFDLSNEVLWVSDSCVLYLGLDDKLRPYQLVHHDLRYADDDAAATVVCYEEEDEAFWVGSLGFSADEAYVLFSSASSDVSEWYGCRTVRREPAMKEDKRGGTDSSFTLMEGGGGGVANEATAQSRCGAHAYGCHRQLNGIPLTASGQDGLSAGAADVDRHGKSIAALDRVPVFCLAARQASPPREYDADHHCCLLGPGVSGGGESDGAVGGGGWILTSNEQGCTNFAVFVVPDSEMRKAEQSQQVKEEERSDGSALTGGETTETHGEGSMKLSTYPARWWPLFAYDPAVKVEGVECFHDFLLISVRRTGSPTVLWCPLTRVWEWWASVSADGKVVAPTVDGSTTSETPLCDSDAAISLSELIDLADAVRCAELTAAATGGDGTVRSDPDTTPVASEELPSLWNGVTLAVSTLAERGHRTHVEHERKKANPGKGRAEVENAADVPPSAMLVGSPWCASPEHAEKKYAKEEDEEEDEDEEGSQPLHWTPLPYAVESYSCTTSFTVCVWRVVVSHLLHPSVQYEVRYTPGEVPNSSWKAAGTLQVKKLREEHVNGDTVYDASEYDGAVIWVPSEYAFTEKEKKTADAMGRDTRRALCRVPTKEPAAVVEVPVAVCWRKGTYARGARPMLLHVYGSYGDCSDPEFSTERLSVLDRGLVWASACVRGGGELGVTWRDAGRKLQRATAVNDFVSVAAYLQDHNVCVPGGLVACGGSAGGLVVFRAMNVAPALFHAIIGAVPFVDCLTTLLDERLPLTVTEWDEFGNPAESEEAYRFIKAISPLDTLPTDGTVVFPHVLLETAWGDSRVGYWESMKLVARLRQLWACTATAKAGRHLLHYCDFGGGHAGASGRYQQLREIAREYAFALYVTAEVLPSKRECAHRLADEKAADS